MLVARGASIEELGGEHRVLLFGELGCRLQVLVAEVTAAQPATGGQHLAVGQQHPRGEVPRHSQLAAHGAAPAWTGRGHVQKLCQPRGGTLHLFAGVRQAVRRDPPELQDLVGPIHDRRRARCARDPADLHDRRLGLRGIPQLRALSDHEARLRSHVDELAAEMVVGELRKIRQYEQLRVLPEGFTGRDDLPINRVLGLAHAEIHTGRFLVAAEAGHEVERLVGLRIGIASIGVRIADAEGEEEVGRDLLAHTRIAPLRQLVGTELASQGAGVERPSGHRDLAAGQNRRRRIPPIGAELVELDPLVVARRAQADVRKLLGEHERTGKRRVGVFRQRSADGQRPRSIELGGVPVRQVYVAGAEQAHLRHIGVAALLVDVDVRLDLGRRRHHVERRVAVLDVAVEIRRARRGRVPNDLVVGEAPV